MIGIEDEPKTTGSVRKLVLKSIGSLKLLLSVASMDSVAGRFVEKRSKRSGRIYGTGN